MEIPEFDDLVAAMNSPIAPEPEGEPQKECSSEMQVLLNILETVTRIETKLDERKPSSPTVSPEFFSPTLELF